MPPTRPATTIKTPYTWPISTSKGREAPPVLPSLEPVAAAPAAVPQPVITWLPGLLVEDAVAVAVAAVLVVL